jgi:proteic killer suppression protein
MIKAFGSKRTKMIWYCERVVNIPVEIQQIGRRKLRMLNNSASIEDLKIPPSNRLEKLKGKYKDYYSIRINNKWRIIFIWDNGNAYQVKIEDYHK